MPADFRQHLTCVGRLLAVLLAAALWATPRAAWAQAPLEPGEVEVGFAAVDVTPPVGVPLAGYSNRRAPPTQWFAGHPYAFYFRPSTGVHDAIEAHAMAIVRGTDRLVFLRLDLVAVSTDLIAALRGRLADLALGEDQLVVTATHTHSGPGSWMDSTVWALIGTDRYRPAVLDGIVAGAARAVRGALAGLAPARLFAASFTAPGLQVNRRDRQDPVDQTANLLLARDRDGIWRGGLINFAIHPTALPASNLAYSADVAGAFEHEVGAALQARNGAGPQSPVTLLFLNGALGDVSPARRNFAGAERLGREFAQLAGEAIDKIRPIDPAWTIDRAEIDLGSPYIAVQNCIRQDWLRWMFRGWLNIPMGSVVSRRAALRLIRFGDLAMMTWPGEPTSALGLELRNAALAAGAAQPIVLGIAGDYKAYFTAPPEYAKNSYESCMSWFGPDGGTKIVEAYRRLLATPPH